MTLGAVLALALLAYTQALLNFGLLLPMFLLAQVVFDRTPGARRRQLAIQKGQVHDVDWLRLLVTRFARR